MKYYYLFLAILLVSLGSAHEGQEEDVETMGVEDATHHFEVVLKTLDGVDVPYATVDATFVGADGHAVSVHLHPMLGGFFHYGSNIELRKQVYDVQLHIDPPTLMRSQSRAGWFETPLDVSFSYDASQVLSGMESINSTEVDDVFVELLVMPASPHITMDSSRSGTIGGGIWRMWAFLVVGVLFGVMATWALLTEHKK